MQRLYVFACFLGAIFILNRRLAIFFIFYLFYFFFWGGGWGGGGRGVCVGGVGWGETVLLAFGL